MEQRSKHAALPAPGRKETEWIRHGSDVASTDTAGVDTAGVPPERTPNTTTPRETNGDKKTDDAALESPSVSPPHQQYQQPPMRQQQQQQQQGSATSLYSMQLSPVAPFVSKTYGIVNGESDEVVCWSETGGEDTFVIKCVKVFQEQVLPRFFCHSNYSSFVRQLNNHGESLERKKGGQGGSGRGRGGEGVH